MFGKKLLGIPAFITHFFKLSSKFKSKNWPPIFIIYNGHIIDIKNMIIFFLFKENIKVKLETS